MIIKDINVNNFGKLSDFRLSPCRGLNIIYAPNESGKTSLMSFIKYVLYGTKQKKHGSKLTFKEKYTPWSGLPMGGSIEAEYCANRYIIQRSEQGNSSKLSVFNLTTGEKEDNIENAGIYFMGMGEQAFSDSAYISDIHSIRTSAGDGEILSQLLNSDANKKTYTRIKNELTERYLEITSPKRKGSFLSLTDAEIKDNDERLRSCNMKIEDAGRKISDAKDIQNRINILNEEQNKLKALQKYQDYIRFNPISCIPKSNNNGIKFMVSAIFFAIFSALFFAVGNPASWKLTIGALSGVSSLLCFFISYRHFLLKKTREEQERLYDKTFSERKKQLEDIKTELNMTDDEIKYFTNRDIDVIIKGNEEKIKEMFLEVAMSERLIQDRSELCTERELLLNEAQRLKDKKSAYLKKAEIINTALDILNSAFSELRDDIFPDVCKKTLEIYSYVTGSECELISSDESFDISLVQNGHVRDASYLSKGSIDILYFSLRLAVIDSISDDKERIPIFMDDIFSNCDDERTCRLLDMLLSLSKKNQIFFITCKSREGEYFRNNREVKIFNSLKG